MSTAESDDERRAKGLPPEPVAMGEDIERPETPSPVKVSFWLWVASGVVFVLGYVMLFVLRDQAVQAAIRNTKLAPPRITPDTIRAGLSLLLAMLMVGAICYALLSLLFAWKARQGTRSARTVLTIMTLLSLLFQLLSGYWSPVTLIGSLIGLVALLLMFLPKVTPYFGRVQRAT